MASLPNPAPLTPLQRAACALTEVCRPSIMTSILFPHARKTRGVTETVAARASASGFFSGIEFAEVLDAGERSRLRSEIEGASLKATYWVSMVQYDSQYSVSSPDESLRRRAVAELLPHVTFAAECGASAVAMLSGPDSPRTRAIAKESLYRSVLEIAEECARQGIQRQLLETLDRTAHKKHLLGPTVETVEFITRVRHKAPEFYLGFDTAHLRLLGEDPVEMLGLVAGMTAQIHLANCIYDPGQPGFGDHHMPLGAPGFLDLDYTARLFAQAVRSGFFGDHRPMVSMEVAGDGAAGSWQLVDFSRVWMLDAWQRATEYLP